jgi:hypothetical protein
VGSNPTLSANEYSVLQQPGHRAGFVVSEARGHLGVTGWPVVVTLPPNTLNANSYAIDDRKFRPHYLGMPNFLGNGEKRQSVGVYVRAVPSATH